MGAALGLTRTYHTSGELRALSSKCPDSARVRRLLTLALVIDGRPRGEAADGTSQAESSVVQAGP
jgi:hypothetical protein